MENSKAIVVSGGSKGLGRAVVQSLLASGARVSTFSRSQTPFIESCFETYGDRFDWQPVDISDAEQLKAFTLNSARKFGRLDGLVNNAAVGADGVLATMRSDEIERVLTCNLSGPTRLIQAVSRVMLRQRSGSIVNLSSVNAIRGHAGVAVYGAAKAGLDGLTRCLARELGPKGIRINSVAPGYFESEMTAGLSDAQRSQIVRRTPLGRLGQVADIVEVISFLLSPASSFLTGQTLVVDGGITC